MARTTLKDYWPEWKADIEDAIEQNAYVNQNVHDDPAGTIRLRRLLETSDVLLRAFATMFQVVQDEDEQEQKENER